MVQTARVSSVPDRFASLFGRGDRRSNSVDHRFARGGTGRRYDGDDTVVHRVAGRGVMLRRVATRRRLARIDPEAIERRAWRLIGGGASTPMHP